MNTAVSGEGSVDDEIQRLLRARFAIGRERYGHGIIIDEDPSKYGVGSNDWELMALEEALDGLVYSTAALVRVIRKHNDYQPPAIQLLDDNEEIMSYIVGLAEESSPMMEYSNRSPDGVTSGLIALLKGLYDTTTKLVQLMRKK